MNTPTYTLMIPGGRAGTWETLQAMSALSRRASFSPLIRVIADNLEPSDLIRAADRFVRVTLNYQHEDPEWLRDPEYMAQEIAETGVFTGDCDDASMLTAAILLAARIPDLRFAAISLARDQGAFTHVFVESPGGVLDATIPLTAFPHKYVDKISLKLS